MLGNWAACRRGERVERALASVCSVQMRVERALDSVWAACKSVLNVP